MSPKMLPEQKALKHGKHPPYAPPYGAAQTGKPALRPEGTLMKVSSNVQKVGEVTTTASTSACVNSG
jgi:hypothetical protein